MGEGLDLAARLQRDFGYTRNKENTSRQVLEHLALEAIVVERVRGAARNVGRIIVVMTCGDGSRFPVRILRRGVAVLDGRLG